jgi:hypothetical protein
MIKYSVRKNGIITNSWTSDFADEAHYEPCFGKPERWVLHKDEPMAEAYDDADVLEEEMRSGSEGVSQKWVKLKAEYTVEIEDITAQVAQEAINAEALAYLASTDWLIIREVDAGVPCPAEIKTLRAEARAKVVR